MIRLPKDDDALMNECRMDFFRSSGPGGQHVNTSDTAVRLTHLPSGLTVQSQEHRSQHRNRQACIEKLREKVKHLNRRRRPRKKTRTPRRAKEKRLKRKKIRSDKKKLRKPPKRDGF